MTFQFLCPQGHLLQGDEAHMGMQCQCPQCGTAFIIPVVGRPGAAADDLLLAPIDDEPRKKSGPVATADVASELAAFDRPIGSRPAPNVDLSELGLGGLDNAAAAEVLLHIPCPNGHELETPPDMIGQRVLCPHCKVEFRLRREKSIEYLHQQEIIDRQRARFWFQLAIVAACFVGVVLLAMVGFVVFS